MLLLLVTDVEKDTENDCTQCIAESNRKMAARIFIIASRCYFLDNDDDGRNNEEKTKNKR